MATWFAAILLSVATWWGLAFRPDSWQGALFMLAIFVVAVWALHVAMVSNGRRAAVVSVAHRIAILLIVVPNILLALALILGNDDAELSVHPYVDLAHTAFTFVYFAPVKLVSTLVDMRISSMRMEHLLAMAVAAGLYMLSAALALCLAAGVAAWLPRIFALAKRPMRRQ